MNSPVSQNININLNISFTDFPKFLKNFEGPDNEKKQKILNLVAVDYATTACELKKSSRSKEHNVARRMAIYLFREILDLSFEEIAATMSMSERTSAMFAYQKIAVERLVDKSLDEKIKKIIERV